MKQSDLEDHCELQAMIGKILSVDSKGEALRQFADFFMFCFERLSKGDSVQEVWNDYQGKGQ